MAISRQVFDNCVAQLANANETTINIGHTRITVKRLPTLRAVNPPMKQNTLGVNVSSLVVPVGKLTSSPQKAALIEMLRQHHSKIVSPPQPSMK